jgi:spermidine synthase
VELREVGVEGGISGSDDEVAQIQVLVGGVVPVSRDVVDIDVERLGGGGVEPQAADPRLLEGLAKGDFLPRRLSGLGVASGLQPAIELAVAKEQHPLAVRRHDERAPGEVALDDRAVEGVGMAPYEGEDPIAVSGLLLVGGGVAAERLDEGGARVGRGHGTSILPAGVGRRLVRTWPRGHSLLQSAARPMSAPSLSPALERVSDRVPVLVALSGAAALVYESQWMRSFGLIFGDTTDAVAWVLAVFMGGLALGSALAARRASADPLRAYARVELGVGVAALATLPLLRALPWAYGGLAGRLGLEGALELLGRVVLAAVVLLPATALLGATVPLAVEVLARTGRPVRPSFGRLYLLNTLGGAVGVALGPFVLVPVLGVSGAVLAAATVSLMVGGMAWRWRREAGPLPPSAERPGLEDGVAREASAEPPRREGEESRPLVGIGPALAAVTGGATFGVEILWTRSYALVIGSSVHAFNIMLLAVLLGLVGGTLVYGRLRARVRRPVTAAGLVVAAGGAAVLAGEWVIGGLPAAYLAALRLVPVSFAAEQLAGFLLCLVTMLPVTLLLGLGFPLLMHLPGTEDRPAQVASGRLYAWNTAGAIGGALLADLLLVPRLGLQPSYLVFAALLLVGGAAALATRVPAPRPVRRLVPAGLALGLLALVPRWEPWDPVVMTSGVYRYGLEWRDEPASAWDLGRWLREKRTQVFYREGAEAVVGVSETRAGRRFLSVNGKTDAGSGVEDVVTQRFIAHVPMLLHPSPRRALVIGWGAGATAASVGLYPVESLECVEIEPATWEAAPLFSRLSGSLRDDPRFHISFRDGRNYLLRSPRAWDVIVSEPSNPWISGVSNLFTREFYEIVRRRLAPGGVFGQWFHYYNLAAADVKVEAKTFLTVFPHASLWLVPPVESADGTRRLGADLLLVGSAQPQALEWTRLVHTLEKTRVGDDLRSTRVLGDPLALVAAWTMGRPEMERWVQDEEVFPGGTPLNTDDHPYIELVAPRRNVMTPADAARAAAEQYGAMGRAGGDARDVLHGHPGSSGNGQAAALLCRQLAERYLDAKQPERALAALDAATRALPGDATARTRAGEVLVEQGRPDEALDRLRSAVRVDPDDVRAWDLLGQVAIDRRDYPLAEEAHRAMLRREPSNVTAWLRLAAVLARQEKWSEAQEALEWARQIDRNAPIDPDLERYIAGRASAQRAAGGR